ncbi:MAG TPA: sigma-70 family RNA polymerase sigma factor [Gaiellales bacterium]|nr:sigma-70 family RNA polymerase sigma factor [Gaiellales bacterium]
MALAETSVVRTDSGRVLTVLYQEHAAEAFRYALHLTGRRADAEDIVQQVFLLAHRHLESGRDLVSPRPWLLTAVRHRAFNLARDHREIPVDEVAAAAVPREQSRDEAAELAEVRGMLWTLPEAQHQAFVLRHWSGLSQGEIAEVLETTPAAVESLLVRARAALLRSHDSASETCSRIRRRLLGAATLGTADEAHVASCRSCGQARARLARAANLAGTLALVPGTHVADSLARLIPGFSAHAATSAAAAGTAGVGAGAGSGGATAGWGTTTAVTTAGKMTVVAKAAAAVVAATAVVGTAAPAQHALTRLVERYASAYRPAPERKAVSPAPTAAGTGPAHAPAGQAPAVPAPDGSRGHAPPPNPGKHTGAGDGHGHGKPADPGAPAAGAGKGNGHAPKAGGNGKAVGPPAGAGGHGGGKPAGAGGGAGKPAGTGGGSGNAGGNGNAGANGNAGGNGNGGGKPAGAGGGKP